MGPTATTERAHPALVARRAATRLRLDPVAAVRVLIALLFVGNLGRIPVIGTGVGKDAPILVNDVALVGFLAIATLALVRDRTLRLDRTALYGLGFVLVGGTSALLAVPRFGLDSFQILFSLAYLARWVAYFALYVAVVNVVRRGEVEQVWRALEGTALALAGFGVFQAAFLPDLPFLIWPDARRYLDWDPQGHRLVSTYLDPNFIGGVFVLVLLVQLARLALGVRMPMWRPGLVAFALLLTVSRSSVLALLVGGAIVLAAAGMGRRLRRFVLAGLALLALALPAIIRFADRYNKLELDYSAISRVVAWLRAWEVFSDNPVIGVGFNTYGFVQRAYGFAHPGQGGFSLDGGIVFIAVMTGVVGVAVFAAMCGSVVLRCRRTWRRTDRPAAERGLAIGVGAGTVAIVVHSLFINSLLYPFVMEPLFVLWALATLVAAPRAGAAVLDAPAAAPRPFRLVAPRRRPLAS